MSKSHVIQQEQKVAHRYPLCYCRYQQSSIKTYFYSSKRKAAKSFLKIPKGLFLVMVIPYVGSFMYLTALIWFIFNISLYGIWLLQWIILWILPDTLKMTSFLILLWTSFLIMDKFPHYGQVSSLWISFLIMDKFPHFPHFIMDILWI